MIAVRRLAWRLFGLSVVGYIMVVVTIWQTTADYQRYNVDFREIDDVESEGSSHQEENPEIVKNYRVETFDTDSQPFPTTPQPTLYLITATYLRPTQRADLTRLAQTVASIPNHHWIVVEDSADDPPIWLQDLLTRLHVNHTLLGCRARPQQLLQQQLAAARGKLLAKGFLQRNCGLGWIQEHDVQDGVLYFVDDDNSYDLRVFEEMRKASTVAMVPTGNLRDSGVSSPLLEQGKVVDWIDPWPVGRRFMTDMASFAINIAFWRARGSPIMSDTLGQLESKLLTDMGVQYSELQPRAQGCSRVWTWHTQTEWDQWPNSTDWQTHMKKHPQSNLKRLLKALNPLLRQHT